MELLYFSISISLLIIQIFCNSCMFIIYLFKFLFNFIYFCILLFYLSYIFSIKEVNIKKMSEETITVAVRIRPLSQKEVEKGEASY